VVIWMSKSRDLAYDFIRNAVLSGEFKPGERLIENTLVDLIGVSRTPIREAIKLLATDNYLVMRPNSGAAVANWSMDELEDIFHLRAMIEGSMTERAVHSITNDGIAQLIASADAIDEILVKGSPFDIPKFLEENHKFHTVIRDAAGSEAMEQALRRLISPPIIYQVAHNYSLLELERSNSHHREIIDSMIVKDGHWANHAMQTHVRSSFNRIRSIMKAKNI